MRSHDWRRLALTALFLAACAAPARAQSPQASAPAVDHEQRYAMIAAEDARPVTRGEAAALIRGLGSPSPEIVRLAVRGLGRLERAEFLPDLVRVLGDADPLVRAEAANAIAQIAAGAPAKAAAALGDRLEIEHEGIVRAALLDALGRMPFGSAEARIPVERALAAALGGEFSPLAIRLAAARGLESLIRRARGTTFAASAETLTVLRAAARGTAHPGGHADEIRVRRTAILALNLAGAADATYERLVLDRDDQIRRLVVAGAGGSAPVPLRDALVRTGLADVSPLVRYEALRVHARHAGAADCAPELAAADDPNPHVHLLAIDLLATACPADAAATDLLVSIVAPRVEAVVPGAAPGPTGGDAGRSWHRPAHALAALSQRAPARTRPLLEPFVAHPVSFARVYAARAAASAGETSALMRLLDDEHATVRAAAIDGLRAARGHDIDDRLLQALARPDYPVVLAVARALEGTQARAGAAPVLLRALATITSAGQDTSRDARLALLDRLRELGDVTHADALAPYLADPDPRVAARAGEILTAWTGHGVEIKTWRLKTLPVPSRDDLDRLPLGLRVTMAGGGRFDIRLRTNEAPISVWRVVRLVHQGYYDGLTFHRVVPAFVIQGGSPGADEYVGDGPFMRDELTAGSHLRGTLGISTRGRDTGDAQWFVNLVDNVRLDHDFTLFGDVVAGLDVVDAILEGDVMVRVEPLPAPESSRRSVAPRRP